MLIGAEERVNKLVLARLADNEFSRGSSIEQAACKEWRQKIIEFQLGLWARHLLSKRWHSLSTTKTKNWFLVYNLGVRMSGLWDTHNDCPGVVRNLKICWNLLCFPKRLPTFYWCYYHQCSTTKRTKRKEKNRGEQDTWLNGLSKVLSS